jgi:hypothetical protein
MTLLVIPQVAIVAVNNLVWGFGIWLPAYFAHIVVLFDVVTAILILIRLALSISAVINVVSACKFFNLAAVPLLAW